LSLLPRRQAYLLHNGPATKGLEPAPPLRVHPEGGVRRLRCAYPEGVRLGAETLRSSTRYASRTPPEVDRSVPGGLDAPLRPIGAGSRPFTGRGLRSKPLVAGPLCKRYACLLGRRLKLLRIGAVSSFAYFIPGSSPGCLSPFPHGTVALSISHPLLRLWGRYPVKF